MFIPPGTMCHLEIHHYYEPHRLQTKIPSAYASIAMLIPELFLHQSSLIQNGIACIKQHSVPEILLRSFFTSSSIYEVILIQQQISEDLSVFTKYKRLSFKMWIYVSIPETLTKTGTSNWTPCQKKQNDFIWLSD